MYMGLVQGVATIERAERLPGRTALTLRLADELLTDLYIGASVAVEGVCLSVTAMDGNLIGFDVTKGTLDTTNLGTLARDRVNVERSAKLGDEIGGHLMAGHVSGVARIVDMDIRSDHMWIKLRVPMPWAKYIFTHGFLAVNGASLTVAKAEGDVFTINLIPETIRQTTFGLYEVGDEVNFEVEQQTVVLVETIERTIEAVSARLGSIAAAPCA